MIDAQQQMFDASPERIDITIFEIMDVPVLKNGVVAGTTRIVDYAPTGAEDMVRMQVPLDDLLCVELIDDPHSAQHNIAKGRAAVVQRAMMRYQHANETPDGHMALETWGGLTPVMCKTLRKTGIRSLQELATASEATISRMGGALMNPRKLVEQCNLYLSSMDKTMAASALVQAKEENEALRQRMADMEATFNAKLSEILSKLGGVPATGANVGDDSDLEQLRARARSAGVPRVGNKSRDTLEAELAALTQSQDEAA